MSFYPHGMDMNNGTITVDAALNNPTTIEQRVAEVASKNMFVESLFSSDNAPVEGGGVIYSKTTQKHLYMDKDVENRTPGEEYPVVFAETPEARLARVNDFGGKFAVTDEARRRNQAIDFDNDVTKLSNTITRKLNREAVKTVQEAVDEGDGVNVLMVNTPWSKVNINGMPTSLTEPRERPDAAFATLQAVADTQELGVTYSKLLVHPTSFADLRVAYGTGLKALLDDYSLEAIPSVHVPKTEAYLVDPGQLGFIRYEESLTINTFRDEHRRLTWVQGYAMPVMGVTLPGALGVIKGIQKEQA